MATESDNEKKPVAQPFRPDQTGTSQPNQSSWEEGKPGEVMRPKPEAIPGRPDQK